jgi:hypothetical protein
MTPSIIGLTYINMYKSMMSGTMMSTGMPTPTLHLLEAEDE